MSKWLNRGGHGAIWLLSATLLTKLIGVLQKIPLQNVGGDAVFGLYNMIYPFYQFVLLLAISGIPTAISAIMAEADQGARPLILKASNRFMLTMGIIFGSLVFIMSEPLARLLGNIELASMIEIVALSIVLSPLLASYRGYFQGIKLASYSSISQLIEQIIRVAIMVILLYIGVKQQWSAIQLTTYVMWGGVAGATIALLYVMNVYWTKPRQAVVSRQGSLKVHIQLLVVRGMPAALAAVIVPLIAVIDTVTVPALLKTSMSFTLIAEQFGLYSRIQPLVQLVSMLLAAIVAGLLPDIVKQYKDDKGIETHMQPKQVLLLRYTMIIGTAATIGLVILAEPLSTLLYKDILAITWFKQLALMTLPAAVLAVAAPMLLLQKRLTILGVMVGSSLIIKVGMNIILVPSLNSMEGAVHATLVALYVPMIIALIALMSKRVKVAQLKVFSSGLGALIMMALYLIALRIISEQLLHLNIFNRLAMVPYVVGLVLTASGLLLVLLNKFGLLSKATIKDIMSKS